MSFANFFAPALLGIVVWVFVAALTTSLIGVIAGVIAALALGWGMLAYDS